MNVKTLCLGILSFGEATGYEIKKMSADGRFSHFIDASYGSIYPALLRLTGEGLVSCREEHRSGKPDRKVYSITENGRAALYEALREQPAPDKYRSEFLFLMICAGLLDRDRVARAIDDRIVLHEAEIAKLDEAMECCGAAASRFVIGYGLAMHSAARRYLGDRRDAALDLAGTEAPVPETAE
jgi:DNA-binding PadR family transcriptional regulator